MNNGIFRKAILVVSLGLLIVGFISKNQQIQATVLNVYLAVLFIKISVLTFSLVKHYDHRHNFKDNLESYLKQELPAFYLILIQEMLLLKYAFLVWKRKEVEGESVFYSYGNNPNIVLYISFFSLIFIETLVVDMVLVKYSYHTMAKISIMSSLYIVVLIVAQIKALKLRSTFITENELVVRYGIIKKQIFSLHDISIIPKPISKDQMMSLGLMSSMETNNVFLHFDEEKQISRLYGIKKSGREIGFFISRKEQFIDTLRNRIDLIKQNGRIA